MKLNEVSSIQVARTKTNMEEFNRVLGGGVWCQESGPDRRRSRDWQIHPTLASFNTAFDHWYRPYVSGKSLPSRLSCGRNVWATSTASSISMRETNMQSIRTEIEKIKPDFLIIDSIQTIMSPDISSVQGSVSQVREVTNELMQIAKTNNIATFIVGHMTKEGTLAGPRTLEHMVDTVLYFEGERQHTFRILRAVKTALAPPTKSAF